MYAHPFSSFLLTDFTSLIGDAIPKAYLSRSGIGGGLRMFKRLVKRGNNLTLVIDRPTLDLLHIDAETFLDIQIQGKSLVVTPVHTDDRKKEISRSPGKWKSQIWQSIEEAGGINSQFVLAVLRASLDRDRIALSAMIGKNGIEQGQV